MANKYAEREKCDKILFKKKNYVVDTKWKKFNRNALANNFFFLLFTSRCKKLKHSMHPFKLES